MRKETESMTIRELWNKNGQKPLAVKADWWGTGVWMAVMGIAKHGSQKQAYGYMDNGMGCGYDPDSPGWKKSTHGPKQ